MKFPDVSQIGAVNIEGAGRFLVLMVKEGHDWQAEIRRSIAAELELLQPEKKMRQFDLGAAAAYNYVLATLSSETVPDEGT